MQLEVSAHGENTTTEEYQTYAAAVQFLAGWFEKQDGANGKDTEGLFDELKHNVCVVMVGDAVKGD
jgi:hypothetical protein